MKPLMRRAFLVEHALGYDPELRNHEDFLLYVSCLAAGGLLLLVPDALYCYRVGAPKRVTPVHFETHRFATMKALDIAAVERNPAARRLLLRKKAILDHRIDLTEAIRGGLLASLRAS